MKVQLSFQLMKAILGLMQYLQSSGSSIQKLLVKQKLKIQESK